MLEILATSLLESVSGLIFGKVIQIAVNKGVRRRGSLSLANQRKDTNTSDKTPSLPLISLKGELGNDLMCAYKEFIQNNDITAINNYIQKAALENDITLVVEFSRKIEEDVRIQLGRRVEYLISHVEEIPLNAFPTIAKRVWNFVRTINTVHKGPKIQLFLSMPVVLGFQLGQLIGLSRYNIELFHFEKGRYSKIPSVKRTYGEY
jgi:hypothetical protein